MADEAGLKICQAIGVDYSQVVTSVQGMAKTYSDLNTILAQTKTSVLETGNAMKTSMGAGVSSIEAEARKAAVTTQDLGAKAKTTGGFLDNLYSPNFIARHLGFIATAGALYGTFGLLDEGLVKYEQGLKSLTTVLPELAGNQQELDRVGQGLIKTMEKYGTSLDDSMAIAKNFGRAYKDQATVLGLVDEVTKLNVVDNVELAQAQAGVQAGLSTYGKTFQDTNSVLSFSGDLIDKITNLSHNALVSASDLSSGLEKASAAALNAKVTLDQFLGLMAAGTKATALPGSQIAQTLKTVFAQLSAPSKQIEEDINRVGVKTRDLNGNLRDAYDIILDLAKATKDAKYSQDDLNLAIEKAARGSFNYAKLAAIVGNYDEILKDVNLSQQASGKTNEVAAQQLGTLARKLQSTKNILIGMFADAGTSGLSVQLKSLVDAINQFLLGLGKVSPLILDTGVALVGLGIALKVANNMYDTISGAVARLIPVKAAATAADVAETVALEAETVATEEATVAATALDAVMDANPIGLITLAVMGLGGALVAYIYHAGQAQKQQLELNQSVDEAAKKYQDLNDKLSKAADGTKEHKDLQAQSNSAMQELARLMPDVVSQWDSEGNAVAIDNDKLRENIELHKQAAIAAANENTVKAEIAAQQAQNYLHASADSLQYYQKNSVDEAGIPAWLKSYREKALVEHKNQTDQARQAADEAQKQADTAWQQWQDLVKGKKTTTTTAGGTPDSSGGGGGGSSSSSGSSTDLQSAAIKALSDEIAKYKIANDFLNQSLYATSAALTINQSQIDLLSNRIKNGTATVKDYADYQSLLTDRQKDLKQEQQGLTDQSDRYKVELQDLNGALNEANGLYEQYKAAGDTKHMEEASQAVQKLQSDIDSMNKTIDSNIAKVNADQKAWEDLANKGYQDKASSLESYVKDFSGLGLLDAHQQLALLNEIDVAQLQNFQDQYAYIQQLEAARKASLEEDKAAAIKVIQSEEDAYKSASDAEIQSLQDQLDLMKQQDTEQQEITDLKDKQTAYAQAELDLQDAQTKLANVQKQKNERVYQNGAWTYMADPKAIADAQKAVTDAQTTATNAYKSLLDAQRKYQEEQLQEQIDAAKKAQTAKLNDFKQQITDMTKLYDDQINKVIKPKWDAIQTINSDNLQELYKNTDKQLTDVEKRFNTLLSNVTSVFTQIQSMTAQMGGTGLTANVSVPKVGASGSSTTNNSSSTNISSSHAINLNGNISLPNVVDASGLIRNLKQLAQ